MVPKKSNPSALGAFRPISCCYVICKCINKILTDRLIRCLDGVTSPQESAFILGRYIAENIMLAQELVKNYHRIGGTLRCAINVDIMKAYEDDEGGFSM